MIKDSVSDLDFLLRDSIECNFRGFSVVYQPQVYAESGKLYGAEALARWRCGKYGEVSPDVFIPVLEKNGKSLQFGRWVFLQAANQCGKWSKFLPDFQMSINLSGCQLQQGNWKIFMEAVFRQLELSHSNITVELTESYPVYRQESAYREVMSLQEAGIQIAMDDFGTGYSSLISLKSLPVNIVKLDREFVSGIADDRFQATFIPSITQMCHNMGKQVCLEGVETRQEYELVRQMGVELIQGYYFGKPLAAEMFEACYLGSGVCRRGFTM